MNHGTLCQVKDGIVVSKIAEGPSHLDGSSIRECFAKGETKLSYPQSQMAPLTSMAFDQGHSAVNEWLCGRQTYFTPVEVVSVSKS